MSDLFAPEGGWRVRIRDNSGGAEEGPDGTNVVEEIEGFPTLMQANEFARRYVRDSLERCRAPGLSTHEVVDAWHAFGEDAEIVDGGEAGWKSAGDLEGFAETPAYPEDRDWRSLDPRRDDGAEDDNAGGPAETDW